MMWSSYFFMVVCSPAALNVGNGRMTAFCPVSHLHSVIPAHQSATYRRMNFVLQMVLATVVYLQTVRTLTVMIMQLSKQCVVVCLVVFKHAYNTLHDVVASGAANIVTNAV